MEHFPIHHCKPLRTLAKPKMGPANVRLNPIGAAACFALGLCVVIYIFGFPDWFQKEQKISLKELLSVSIALVERGGSRVREIRDGNTLADRSKGKTKEGADEVLTEGDMESHRAIVYGFGKTFPGLRVIFLFVQSFQFLVDKYYYYVITLKKYSVAAGTYILLVHMSLVAV